MAEVAVAEEIGSVAWKIIGPFAGFLLAAAIGLGIGEAFEHRGPGPTFTVPIINAKISPFGESLAAQLSTYKAGEAGRIQAATNAGAQAQAAADKPAFAKWQAAVQSAQSDAQDARNAAAAAISTADVHTTNQTAVAFRLGKSTCEVPNAPPAPPGSPSPCPLIGVCDIPGADFADVFNPGAFAPSGKAPVPAGSDGGSAGGAAGPPRR